MKLRYTIEESDAYGALVDGKWNGMVGKLVRKVDLLFVIFRQFGESKYSQGDIQIKYSNVWKILSKEPRLL